jgi:uncharacterized protein (DUF427 family)
VGGSVIATGEEDVSVKSFEGNWYYVPEAVNTEKLRVTDRVYVCPYKGRAHWIDLETAEGRVQNVAWTYFEPKPGYEWIKDRVAFYARDTAGTLTEKE